MKLDVMQFGAERKFQVRIEIANQSESESSLCQFSYVVGGHEFGGSEWFEIDDILLSARLVRGYADKREAGVLYTMPKINLFATIVSILYGETEVDEHDLELSEAARFNLWFHHCLGSAVILLFAHADEARILFAKNRSTEPKELMCSLSDVEYPISEAMDYLESISRLQNSKLH
jgi:hypothetical protein